MDKVIRGKLYESVEADYAGCEECDLFYTALCMGQRECSELIGINVWQLKEASDGI